VWFACDLAILFYCFYRNLCFHYYLANDLRRHFLNSIGLFVIIRKQWTVWAIFFTSTIAQRSSVATQYFSATSVLGTRISFLGKINFSSSGNSRIFYIFVFNLIYILRILSSKTSQTFWIRSWWSYTSGILLTFHVSLTVCSVLLNEFPLGLH